MAGLTAAAISWVAATMVPSPTESQGRKRLPRVSIVAHVPSTAGEGHSPPAHACNVSSAPSTISLDSAAATRRVGAWAWHRPPSSTMKVSGYAERTDHAVHPMALAGAPRPSARTPRNARCARDRLEARAEGAGHALWPVLGPRGRPRCVSTGHPHLVPRRCCPTSSPGRGTACGRFLLVLWCPLTGCLSRGPPVPERLALGRPDAPPSHAGQRAATTDRRGAPGRAVRAQGPGGGDTRACSPHRPEGVWRARRDGSPQHPFLQCVVPCCLLGHARLPRRTGTASSGAHHACGAMRGGVGGGPLEPHAHGGHAGGLHRGTYHDSLVPGRPGRCPHP